MGSMVSGYLDNKYFYSEVRAVVGVNLLVICGQPVAGYVDFCLDKSL